MQCLTPYPAFPLSNGRWIPAIGLGTWLSKPNEVGQAVKTALANGCRHIDCAACYGNEAEIGEQAFEPFLKEGKVLREEFFVTSKLWLDSKRKEDVHAACVKTLQHLRLPYLDLYLIHWPVSLRKGATFPLSPEDIIDVPIEETWPEMERLVDEGLVRSIGVSNFTIPQLEHLLKICRIRPVVNQVEINTYCQNKQLERFCRDHHIHLTAYSPLGNNGNPDRAEVTNVFDDDVVKRVAQKHGKTVAQVVCRFIMQNGHSVIPKSVKPERILSNLDVCTWALDDADMEAIRALDKNIRTCDGMFFKTGKTLKEFWQE